MTPQPAEAFDDDPADAAVAARDDEQAAAARVSAACALVRPTRPELAGFCQAFYAGAPPEDTARYAPESLAALANFAFDLSAVRKPGETLIELFELRPQEGDHTLGETVFLAVNDDMPFLFDSLMGELAAQNIRAHALFHPVVPVRRDANGVRGQAGAPIRESMIVLVLDPVLDEERKKALVRGAGNVFAQVGLAVRDWRRMLARLKETITDLGRNPPPVSREDLDESIAFLEWLGDNHFTFLGCRDYAFGDADGGRLEPIAESGLGLLSDTA
ncbi:MAG: hypothetical protein ACREHV_01685, partial [Rhizomicrobium sp.]